MEQKPKLAKVTYDAADDVMHIDCAGVHLETRAEIRAFLDGVLAFWRPRFRGRKLYTVVCYDGFSVNLRENGYYAEQMKATAAECSITVVRYGGDALQRSAARLRGMAIHAPSNLYETREQALEVVRSLRNGTMTAEG